MNRCERIEERLRAAFEPAHLEVADESARHAGHPGARGGGGHFRVTIVSARFRGMSRVQRHRAVYAALGGMLGGEIHALAVAALTPEEWEATA